MVNDGGGLLTWRLTRARRGAAGRGSRDAGGRDEAGVGGRVLCLAWHEGGVCAGTNNGVVEVPRPSAPAAAGQCTALESRYAADALARPRRRGVLGPSRQRPHSGRLGSAHTRHDRRAPLLPCRVLTGAPCRVPTCDTRGRINVTRRRRVTRRTRRRTPFKRASARADRDAPPRPSPHAHALCRTPLQPGRPSPTPVCGAVACVVGHQPRHKSRTSVRHQPRRACGVSRGERARLAPRRPREAPCPRVAATGRAALSPARLARRAHARGGYVVSRCLGGVAS